MILTSCRILAVMPCNTDPATQDILKLAKEADPTMTRTAAVLTKPDLAEEMGLEPTVINLVLGKRGDLTLGYYVVRNRGLLDSDQTLEQLQVKEKELFDKPRWSALRHTGRAGIACLKRSVRDLLIDLIKKEFPKLRAEIFKELGDLKALRDELGVPRNDHTTQRAYLNRMAEDFQSLVRDSLAANYTENKLFADRHELRLITCVVDRCESFSKEMRISGHMRPFSGDNDKDSASKSNELSYDKIFQDYPELEEIMSPRDKVPEATSEDGIMDYVEAVYKASRGQELGTFGDHILHTLFKEQSKKWNDITLRHMDVIVFYVHRFVSETIKCLCLDRKVHERLWTDICWTR
ncbi:hypothetical protein F5Y17DRAFT_381299 [Xylariaceae sp. FL0594]|nr:hypothetical protein F5Y17DRAFT_381299 [Xylariaceae sp. FL0594]